MFKKMMDYGQAGDNVGILLRGTLYYTSVYYIALVCYSIPVYHNVLVYIHCRLRILCRVYACLYTLKLLTSLACPYTVYDTHTYKLYAHMHTHI